MKITVKGCALGAATLVGTAFLLTQADRISAPHPITDGPAQVVTSAQPFARIHVGNGIGPAINAYRPLPPYWNMTPPSWCQEDMICWIGSKADDRSNRASENAYLGELRHAHDYEPPVPRWLSCNVIDASEFPYKAARAWAHCYENITRYHSRWAWLGHYDRHWGVWQVVGPTTVYVTRAGWFETS